MQLVLSRYFNNETWNKDNLENHKSKQTEIHIKYMPSKSTSGTSFVS